MKTTTRQPLRWLAALACAAALAACGGGGGGSSDAPPVAPPPADARNGDYVMYAADAHQYALSIDFNARTYRVTGNGQDLMGTIREFNTAGKFDFDVAPAAPPSVPGAPQFTWFNDAMVGAFRFPAGTVPFIASRSFVTTLAEAAGTYNYLTRTVDSAGPPINANFTGELLASGTLRQCDDATIFTIALCPPGSVLTSTVTVSGDQFTVNTAGGAFPFRIAKVGTERVFLRASVSTGTTRRFWVGMPEAVFTGGTFFGWNTSAEGTFTDVTRTAYNANWNDGSVNVIRLGGAGALGASSPTGIIGINAGADGLFRAMHNSELLVLVASRSNLVWPGYYEIAKR